MQESRTEEFHKLGGIVSRSSGTALYMFSLDQYHKVFLCHAPEYETGFDDFKKGVSQVTDGFKKISEEIIEIKKTLINDHASTNLGALIGKVQDLEEKKLGTVVDVQLARQQALDNPGDDLC